MTTLATDKAAEPERMTPAHWLAIITVMAGTFVVVTIENLPLGLLTTISHDLRVTDSMVALMVTMSGLVAAVTAPTLPLLIRRLDRRAVLIGLLLLMAVANGLTAAAPNIIVALIARLLAGISIGGFWALAAGLAVRLAPAAFVGKATSIIFLGAMLANVVGLPAGTFIGNATSWQSAFLLMAGLSILLVVAIVALVPKMPAIEPVRIPIMLEQLRNNYVRAGILTTFLLVCGHYGAFAFVSPLLQTVAHVSVRATSPLLALFGGAAIIGNLLAGVIAGRNVRKSIILVSLLLAACLIMFPLLGRGLLGAMPLLGLWGLSFGGLPVVVQTWIFKKAPNIEAATSLNTALFNAAIAFGAFYSGLVTKVIALPMLPWIAAIPVIGAAIIMAGVRAESGMKGKP